MKRLLVCMVCLVIGMAVCPVWAGMIHFNQGWNFISIPEQDCSGSPDVVLTSIKDNVGVVWGFQNESKSWLKYVPNGQGNTLLNMRYGLGYWVYMLDAVVWLPPQTSLWPKPPSIPILSNPMSGVAIYPGWSLIGYTAEFPDYDPVAYLIGTIWDTTWTYDDQWRVLSIRNVPGYERIIKMNEGKAYWLKQ